MSLPFEEYLGQIALEAGKVAIGIGIGVVIKKTFWRKAIWIKKWLANDILTMSLLAVREYPYTDVKDMNISVFDHVKTKIPGVTLVQRYSNGMMIYVPPIFGNLIVEVEASNPVDEEEYDAKTKLTLRTENTIRIGMKEFKHLNDFEKYAESIFDTIDAFLFDDHKPAKSSFAICDITRTAYLVEQKQFELRDKVLNTRVQGTDDRLTITASPIGNIKEATQKYHFR